MRAVGQHLDAVGVRHVGDLAHRHDLAHPVDHVRHVDQLRPRRDGLFVGLHDHRVVFDGEVEAELLVDDAFAQGALAVGLDHVRVVLLGADDLVAGLQVEPVDDRVQRLGGVAVDGDLVGRGAGQRGQLLAQRLAALVENAPHVVGRPLVGELVVALHRLLHHDGRGRDSAVVQVHEVGIHRVGALNHRPVVFVLRGLVSVEVRDARARRVELGGVGLLEEAVGGEGAGKRCGLLEEGAAAVEIPYPAM